MTCRIRRAGPKAISPCATSRKLSRRRSLRADGGTSLSVERKSMKSNWNAIISLIVVIANLAMFKGQAMAQNDLVQVTEDFSADPGWDNSNNRVQATNPPTVKQDFGWSQGKI